MKSKVLLLIFLLGIPFFAYANNMINDYLLAAQMDIDHRTSGDNVAGEMSAVSSWIEKAQFRFNAIKDTNSDSDSSSQSYEIRVKPKAWGQSEIEKNILQLRLEQQDNHYHHLLNAALKKRYTKLLDYLEKWYKTRYLFKLSQLSQQEISLYRRQVNSVKFNAENLLDAESASQQSTAMAKLNLTRLNAIQAQLGLAQDTGENLLLTPGIDWLINISEMSSKLFSISDAHQLAPEVRNAQLKMQLAKAETELNKTGQQLGLNLLSFEYRDREQDAMVFQLGVNIPVGTKFSAVHSQYDLSTAQSQLDNSLTVLQQSLDEIETEITWLREELKLTQTQIQHTQKKLQNDFVKNQPFLGINLRKQLIEQNKKSTDIQQKTLYLYISYLTQSGQLVQRPLRNWIQSGTPELLSSHGY